MLAEARSTRLGQLRVSIWRGDICAMDVDAVVNAASKELLGGGGVDGAIHRAAGPELLKACQAIGGCATGEAVITPGFRMLAKHVIHSVGPVWKGGTAGEPLLLERCYRACLALAEAEGIKSLAFPAISTGVYGYPKPQAAGIALRTTAAFQATPGGLAAVHFVLFDAPAEQIYLQTLSELR